MSARDEKEKNYVTVLLSRLFLCDFAFLPLSFSARTYPQQRHTQRLTTMKGLEEQR